MAGTLARRLKSVGGKLCRKIGGLIILVKDSDAVFEALCCPIPRARVVSFIVQAHCVGEAESCRTFHCGIRQMVPASCQSLLKIHIALAKCRAPYGQTLLINRTTLGASFPWNVVACMAAQSIRKRRRCFMFNPQDGRAPFERRPSLNSAPGRVYPAFTVKAD